MARVQYGVIVTELKGNVGGSTFQNGNVSKVLRNKGYRKGTSSLARQAANHSLVSQAVRWKGLSAGNVALWEAFKGSWAFTDKFGNVYYSSAYQVFNAYNSGLLAIELPVVNAPLVPDVAQLIVVSSFTYSLAVGPILTWGSLTTTVQVLQVFATSSLSPGVNNNNLKYKLIGLINTDAATGYTGAAGYNNVYGAPILGSKVVFKCQLRPVNMPRVVQTIIISAIVTA